MYNVIININEIIAINEIIISINEIKISINEIISINEMIFITEIITTNEIITINEIKLLKYTINIRQTLTLTKLSYYEQKQISHTFIKVIYTNLPNRLKISISFNNKIFSLILWKDAGQL